MKNTGKRQHLQDIYASDKNMQDDYTLQVSASVIRDRDRQIRRHHIISSLLGLAVLTLLLTLAFVIVKEYQEVALKAPTPTAITREYIPRYSLPEEAKWVMDFSKSHTNPAWDGEGQRPFNADWICKAAHNLILAQQADNKGEYRNAAEFYENVLTIFPDLEGVKVPLGTLYFKLQEYEHAIALLEKIPEADLTPDVLNNLGAACLNAEIYDRAEKYLKRAADEAPTYSEPIKNLAELYRKQKIEAKAVAAFEKYIDLKPGDFETQHTFALYLTQIGDWERATKLLRHLTQEITDVPVLYFLLARAETRQGNTTEALAAIKRGAQLSDPRAALMWMDEKQFDALRQSEDFQLLIRQLETTRK